MENDKLIMVVSEFSDIGMNHSLNPVEQLAAISMLQSAVIRTVCETYGIELADELITSSLGFLQRFRGEM